MAEQENIENNVGQDSQLNIPETNSNIDVNQNPNPANQVQVQSLEERLQERLQMLYEEQSKIQDGLADVDKEFDRKQQAQIDEIKKRINDQRKEEKAKWNDALKRVEGAIQVLEDEMGVPGQ